MGTFDEYARNKIEFVLCKERAKCCRRNGSQNNFSLPADDAVHPSARKFLSTIMPPRTTWRNPCQAVRTKRFIQKDGRPDTKKIHRYALQKTIEHDRQEQAKGKNFPYLDRLDRYVNSLLERIRTNSIRFTAPQLQPLHKSTERDNTDGHRVITYRPLSVYTALDDKVILSLASMYLARYFNAGLHPSILSYRPPRTWRGQKQHVTDFNDGILAIADFRNEHADETVYAADCDIKKFYDTLHHPMIRSCVNELLDQRRDLNEEGKAQIRAIIDAYLESYNFYDHVLLPSQQPDFNWSPAYKRHQRKEGDICRFGWIGTEDLERCYGAEKDREQHRIGVPQGGALSLNIANIVLNHVDRQAGLADHDARKLFLRFCDDMILLHTDSHECERLMNAYCQALTDHKLIFHEMQDIRLIPEKDKRKTFWHQKSHFPFLWADGEGNCNRYIGFLGYEMRRDGQLRLRKSNELKWTDKWQNYYRAICRQIKSKEKKKGEPLNESEINELAEKANQWLRSLEKTKDFYIGFDWDDPARYDVRQWVHIHQREKSMLRMLRKRFNKIDAVRWRPLIRQLEEVKDTTYLIPNHKS